VIFISDWTFTDIFYKSQWDAEEVINQPIRDILNHSQWVAQHNEPITDIPHHSQ
jgi:hypothetical protein